MTRPPQQNNRHSLLDDELHAFDLTWRNYLPSVSSFCCFKSGNIRLDDEEPFIEPAYYNDHTLYRGEALQNYLEDSRDWEFESVLGQSELPVTRNPFGTASIKKKKNKSKKKKSKKERSAVMETDMEDTVVGYDIEQDQSYYHEDAEFLEDDQIANLAYHKHSQVMDTYGQEIYHDHGQGPKIQEMRTPPSHEFYAARAMPTMHFEQQDEYEESVIHVPAGPSYTTKPQVSIEAAQALLSERLDDLTEKLAYIKNNIIHIPTSTAKPSDDECDTNTLHTLNKTDIQQEQNSCSDMDSITSQALEVYENENNTKRYSSGDEFHIPSLHDHTPFVSDQHPFTYFTEQNQQEEQDLPKENTVQSIVFDFGKKWLGV